MAVRIIYAFVGEIELAETGFERVQPASTGRPGYAPATILERYVYGYRKLGIRHARPSIELSRLAKVLEDGGPKLWAEFMDELRHNRMLELVTNALSTEGVVIVGATNHVDRIDPALTRSGRLDEIIRIELPDAEAIVHILARYAGLDVSRQELSSLSAAPQLPFRAGKITPKLNNLWIVPKLLLTYLERSVST